MASSNPYATLSMLAPELLLEINEHLPIASTASLARVNQRFNAVFAPRLAAWLRDKRARTPLYPSGGVYVTNLEWAACRGHALMLKTLLETGCWRGDDIPARCKCAWGACGSGVVFCRMCAYEQSVLMSEFLGGGRDYRAVRLLLSRYRDGEGKAGAVCKN